MFFDKGPPWALGRSCLHMRAGWPGLRDSTSAEKYSGRVLLSSEGSRAPSTAESVIRRRKHGDLKEVSTRRGRLWDLLAVNISSLSTLETREIQVSYCKSETILA